MFLSGLLATKHGDYEMSKNTQNTNVEEYNEKIVADLAKQLSEVSLNLLNIKTNELTGLNKLASEKLSSFVSDFTTYMGDLKESFYAAKNFGSKATTDFFLKLESKTNNFSESLNKLVGSKTNDMVSIIKGFFANISEHVKTSITKVQTFAEIAKNQINNKLIVPAHNKLNNVTEEYVSETMANLKEALVAYKDAYKLDVPNPIGQKFNEFAALVENFASSAIDTAKNIANSTKTTVTESLNKAQQTFTDGVNKLFTETDKALPSWKNLMDPIINLCTACTTFVKATIESSEVILQKSSNAIAEKLTKMVEQLRNNSKITSQI